MRRTAAWTENRASDRYVGRSYKMDNRVKRARKVQPERDRSAFDGCFKGHHATHH